MALGYYFEKHSTMKMSSLSPNIKKILKDCPFSFKAYSKDRFHIVDACT